MKFHDLADVCAKVGRAVIAGIEMEFVLDVLFLKLLVEDRSANLKSIFVILSAVEIDGQRADRSFIFPGQRVWIVFLPVRNVDGIAKDGSQQPAQRSTGA